MKNHSTPDDQNTLAFELADALQDATAQFIASHPGIGINAIMGAANCFLATWLVHAPSKAESAAAMEQNFAIIRNLINQTPEAFFGGTNPNLN